MIRIRKWFKVSICALTGIGNVILIPIMMGTFGWYAGIINLVGLVFSMMCMMEFASE